MTLVYMGLAEALDEELTPYDFRTWVAASSNWVEARASFVRSPNSRFAVPEVIRLVRYDRIPHREVAFTRHNVFARDRHRHPGQLEEAALRRLDGWRARPSRAIIRP
ncbi:MAG: hypothetical protein HY079_01310 [Elusimicrobia bacterium]|nr:hypothetical protein [Elusimicrobiota bacterium]